MSLLVVMYGAIVVATAVLATGYGVAAVFWPIPVLVLAALLWLSGERRGWRWISHLALVLFVTFAALGLLLGMALVTAVVAVVAALVAWDSDRFHRLLANAAQVKKSDALERHYKQRLLIVAASGTILAAVATLIPVNLGFGLALLLALLSLLGFSRALSFLRRQSDA